MKLKVELEQEEDGRWIGEVPDLAGVLAYGATAAEARAKVQALALRVVADRLEHGEASSDLLDISFIAGRELVAEHQSKAWARGVAPQGLEHEAAVRLSSNADSARVAVATPPFVVRGADAEQMVPSWT